MEKRLKQNVGIDCAQDELVVSFGTMNEAFEITIQSNTTFKNQTEGFKKLFKWSSKLAQTGLETTYVIEATGVYHERVALYLTQQGCKISVVLPNRAKAFFKTLTNKTVNDKSCGQMLSQLGLEKKLDKWEAPHPVFNELKQLTRERSQVIHEQTQNKNQLHAEESGAWINKQSVKRIKQRLHLLERQLLEITQDIANLIDKHEWLKEKIDRVCSIQGVGLLTAVTVIAETNGFNLIKNKKQLVSYAGLDIVEKTSGTSVQGKPRISKKGNSYLRACVYFPALTAIRNTPEMKALFTRLVSKHGIKKKAAVAVQRKLLELIYVLWKKNEFFDAHYKSLRNKGKEEQPVIVALPELA
jgi:transposase